MDISLPTGSLKAAEVQDSALMWHGADDWIGPGKLEKIGAWYNTSSIAGFERLNHCSSSWMSSMIRLRKQACL